MNRSLHSTLGTALAFVFTFVTGQVALGDDTEIYFGQTQANQSTNPNILFIIDSSGSMNNAVPGDALGRDRMEVVRDVANDFIANMSDVNLGLMQFEYGGDDGDAASEGGHVMHEVAPVETNRTSLTNEVNSIVHYTWTPLQETYYEAAMYYMGRSVDYGRTVREWYQSGFDYYGNPQYSSRWTSSTPDSRTGWTYDSPILGACQKNHIVYLTDGEPTRDKNGTPKIVSLLNENQFDGHTSTSCANPDNLDDGGECLDELAEFLYENDLDSNIDGKQNITSHFIGFAEELPFLEDAADAGGGLYRQAFNADELTAALAEIFNEVTDQASGFTAPAVTVNAFDRTSHLDQLFFTVFQPNNSHAWGGNVKKYRLREKQGDLQILGRDNKKVVDPATGYFYDGLNELGEPDPSAPIAWSYWSDEPDGANVYQGGAAEQFANATRFILTHPGSGSKRLKNHPISDGVNGLEAALLAGGATSGELEDMINWMRGIDAFDSDGDLDETDSRNRMGDPLHSKPLVLVYGGTDNNPNTSIFVGTNEGFLHSINGRTGYERWAFMPKELWSNVPKIAREDDLLPGEKRKYGVDGQMTVWKYDGGDGQIEHSNGDFAYLYFGMRRGGSAYYAVNVTRANNPFYMWKYSADDNPKMGQSWSKPVHARVNFGSEASPNVKDVIILGGGYDPAQDDKTSYSADTVGNTIVMLDALTGAELWTVSNSGADLNLSDMRSSFPSGVRVFDLDRDGVADRMYANDIVGRLFRFDIHEEEGFDVTGGVIAELGATANGGTANNRRFYYEPDVALGNSQGTAFLNITTASGYRAHPLAGGISDYLFAVRDYNPFERLGADDNVAEPYDYGIVFDDLYAMSAGSNTVPPDAKGFSYTLGVKEKALARSRIFQNKAYYTTYTPGAPPAGNPCAPAVGRGDLYTIDLGTGVVTNTELNKPGIPPEPTFVFGNPYDPDEPLDDCFGPHCTPNPDDQGSDDDYYEETSGNEREVKCLAGPESCQADSSELPQRTFWRRQDSD